MKTLTGIILLFVTITLISCDSATGPMGPPGQDGEDGSSIIGSVFEIEGDFRPANDYKLYYEFPQDFEIYDTDIVLVYILWEVAQTDGGNLDVWRLLPQTVVRPEGVIQYNFDYTVYDVQVFMEGTIPKEEWWPGETDNQVFRIVVMPADFLAKKSENVQDFISLKSLPGLKLNTLKSVDIEAIR